VVTGEATSYAKSWPFADVHRHYHLVCVI
jgi:hypothetical protein